MAPLKRHAYDAEFKLKAISHAVEHGNRAAAREFNINESMVRKWRKQEEDCFVDLAPYNACAL